MTSSAPEITRQQYRQYRKDAAAAEAALALLSPATIRHIRDTWDASHAAPGNFAADLYANLFAIAPGAASLFSGSLERQQQRLTRTLAESLALLEKPEELVLLLKASGVRHVQYGTGVEHFPLLGSALDTTFRQRLGKGFSAQRRKAWKTLFAHLSAIMCGAMCATLTARA